MALKKKMGWFKESQRHYLAAKGVKTSYMKRKGVGLGFGAENKDAPVESQKVELKRKPDFFVTPEGLVGGIGSTADPNKSVNAEIEERAKRTERKKLHAEEQLLPVSAPSIERIKQGTDAQAPGAKQLKGEGVYGKEADFAMDAFGGRSSLNRLATSIHVDNLIRYDPESAKEYKENLQKHNDALAKELAAKEVLMGLTLPTNVDEVAEYNEKKRAAMEELKEAKRDRIVAFEVLRKLSEPNKVDEYDQYGNLVKASDYTNAKRLEEARAKKQAQTKVDEARGMQTTPEASLKRQLDEEIERANKQLKE